jgi:hypothetical protein
MALEYRTLPVPSQSYEGLGIVFSNLTIVPILMMRFSEVLACKLSIISAKVVQPAPAVIGCILLRLLCFRAATRGRELPLLSLLSIICPLLKHHSDLPLEIVMKSEIGLTFAENEDIFRRSLVIQEQFLAVDVSKCSLS